MKYQYKYCPNCKNDFTNVSKYLFVCPKCDFRIFVSPKPGTGALILNSKGKLLVVKRAYEPYKGLWGIPGGFINPEESAPTALLREIKEEVNLDIRLSDLNYFGSYASKYPYKNIVYDLVNTYYYVKLNKTNRIKLSNEANAYGFVDINKIKLSNFANDIHEAIKALIRYQSD